MLRKQTKQLVGMTLIEMIITLIVLSIIVMIAVPNYITYTRKARRAEATIALFDLAARMEQYYVENNHSYTGASITGNLGLDSMITAQGHYALSLLSLSTSSYMLQAMPVSGSSQVNDNACGNFTLTQAGQKGITGTDSIGECWGN